jgi:hypothetical protein
LIWVDVLCGAGEWRIDGAPDTTLIKTDSDWLNFTSGERDGSLGILLSAVEKN